ncbi:phage protein [Bergeriella denitrificans]|uniref:Phage protein n=1 Tax=Bergeriella denitrificans TaxID=494 RepID=A0A378UTJ4_BERDE|nr:phage protein [Bergeriella denitrificans]
MTQAKQLHSEMGISQDVKLKYPVRLPTGEVLEKVSVRRPKVGDIRAAPIWAAMPNRSCLFLRG